MYTVKFLKLAIKRGAFGAAFSWFGISGFFNIVDVLAVSGVSDIILLTLVYFSIIGLSIYLGTKLWPIN